MWSPYAPTWRQGTGEGEGGERRLEKEKYNFYCVDNKLLYVTPTVCDNFRSLDLSLLHTCF